MVMWLNDREMDSMMASLPRAHDQLMWQESITVEQISKAMQTWAIVLTEKELLETILTLAGQIAPMLDGNQLEELMAGVSVAVKKKAEGNDKDLA